MTREDEDGIVAYDPNVAPDPDQWLALSEFDRMDAVKAFHRHAGGFGHDVQLHATIHMIVENQLALGEPAEVAGAMSRLRGDGLDRHQAIHAIGSVLAEYLFDILRTPAKDVPTYDVEAANAHYAHALSQLTAESWHRDYGPPPRKHRCRRR